MSKRKKKPLRSNKKQGRGPRRASQVRNMESFAKMEADWKIIQERLEEQRKQRRQEDAYVKEMLLTPDVQSVIERLSLVTGISYQAAAASIASTLRMQAHMTDVQNLWSNNDSDPVSDFKAAAKKISESNFRPAPEDPVLLQMHERLRRTTTQLDRSAYGLQRTSVGVSEAQHDRVQHSDVGTKPIIVIGSEGMSHDFRERLAASIAKHYPSRHR
ncbi:hypothetical protein D3C75_135690 [compost metagenome]